MSILLYVAGALFVAIGAAVIGFGIPINEFSFGNTLIIAGTVAMVGGLIVLALGVVVRELQYLADMYGRASVRTSKAPDADASLLPTRATPPPAAARVPFPPKPKGAPPAESVPRESAVPFAPEPRDEAPPLRDEPPPPFPIRRSMTTPVAPPVALPVAAPVPRPQEEVFGAPSLPNPAEIPDFDRSDRFRRSEAEAEEAAELAEAGEWDETEKRDESAEAIEAEPPLFAPGRSRATPSASAGDKPERSYFDAMWPAEPETPAVPEVPPSRIDLSGRVAEPVEPEVEQEEPPAEEPRTVPILKSGVVDGMGYTLYVDGSIEAELPQGTLRFASINELRAHLEKTS